MCTRPAYELCLTERYHIILKGITNSHQVVAISTRTYCLTLQGQRLHHTYINYKFSEHVSLLIIYIAEYCVKHRTRGFDKLSFICITQFQLYYVKLYNLLSSKPCTERLHPRSGECARVYNVINETLGIIVSTVVVNKCKMNRLLPYYIVKH